MIAKEKMFIVSSSIDDSIKASTPVYDIILFPNFVKFEDYINETPCVVSTIIISSLDLPFTSSNMMRLLHTLKAPFLNRTGQCIYLIEPDVDKAAVDNFFHGSDVENLISYQGDITPYFISDVVAGVERLADEAETEIITYRTRASEYVAKQNEKRFQTDENIYITDEEDLNDIPAVEEVEELTPTLNVATNVYYAVGKHSVERTLFAWLEAQYLSMRGKKIIMERDGEYHTLTNMALASQLHFKFVDLDDLLINISGALNDIRLCSDNLIVIGTTNKIDYDYSFLFDIVMNTLSSSIDYFVKECSFEDTPYGCYYNIVCGDTVPEVLECIASLKYKVDVDKVCFVGMQTRNLGELCLNSSEYSFIIQEVLEEDKVNAEIISTQGINLRGDGVVYDLFSVIGRGNQRQIGGV